MNRNKNNKQKKFEKFEKFLDENFLITSTELIVYAWPVSPFWKFLWRYRSGPQCGAHSQSKSHRASSSCHKITFTIQHNIADTHDTNTYYPNEIHITCEVIIFLPSKKNAAANTSVSYSHSHVHFTRNSLWIQPQYNQTFTESMLKIFFIQMSKTIYTALNIPYKNSLCSPTKIKTKFLLFTFCTIMLMKSTVTKLNEIFSKSKDLFKRK